MSSFGGGFEAMNCVWTRPEEAGSLVSRPWRVEVGQMLSLKKSLVIHAPAERVFAYVTVEHSNFKGPFRFTSQAT